MSNGGGNLPSFNSILQQALRSKENNSVTVTAVYRASNLRGPRGGDLGGRFAKSRSTPCRCRHIAASALGNHDASPAAGRGYPPYRDQ